MQGTAWKVLLASNETTLLHCCRMRIQMRAQVAQFQMQALDDAPLPHGTSPVDAADGSHACTQVTEQHNFYLLPCPPRDNLQGPLRCTTYNAQAVEEHTVSIL
jgi:hypothetical protein